MNEIHFKNGSYIKTIESKETHRSNNSKQHYQLIIDYYKYFPEIFIEKFMGVRLLPYQKAYIRLCNKIFPREIKLARGQSYMRFLYAMMYKQLWSDYLKEVSGMSMGGIMGTAMKDMCIEKGDIPSDCKMEGMMIFSKINEGKNPCDDCTCDCSHKKQNETEE